jgi:hypothetical protein
MLMRAVVVALFLAGCSQSPAPPPAGTPLELRPVLVDVRELQVSAGGRALEVEPGQTHLDLTNTGHAWLLGTVRVPDGDDRVDVRLRLDDFGGFESANGAGEIDARAPIHYSAAFGRVAPPASSEVTALVHVDRSLVATGAGRRVFLPQLAVTH